MSNSKKKSTKKKNTKNVNQTYVVGMAIAVGVFVLAFVLLVYCVQADGGVYINELLKG